MAKLKDTRILGDLSVDGEIKNKASTTSEGVVKLNNTVTSSSTTEAATASAVKQAYDRGNHDHPYASTDVATTTTNGLMSSTDKSKLDGIATGANKYTHPTTSGNKHIPSGGSAGQILRWSEDGTAVWGADNNTTYSVATTSANGLMSAADKTKLDGATNANTASKIVMRDASGNFSAGTITATLNGNASTATKLATSRTISLSGAITGSGTFDGSGNLSINTTTNHNHDDRYYTETEIDNSVMKINQWGNDVFGNDLNNWKKAGTWWGTSATTNVPIGDGWGTVLIYGTGDRVTQVFNAWNSSPTKRYVRMFNVDAWSAWKYESDGGNADTVDGKHLDQLFTYTEHASGTSIDTAFETGTHWLYNATGTLPGGYGQSDNDFILQVFRSSLTNSSWQIQIAYDMRSNRIFSRRRTSGTFGSWTELFHSGNSNNFLQIGANQTVTSIKEFISQTVGSDYGQPALQVRETLSVGNAQSAAEYAPAIGFHWANRTAGSIAMHSDGNYHFRAQGYTSSNNIYRKLIASGLELKDYGTPFECGQYIDFHNIGSNADYSNRLESGNGLIYASSGLNAGNSNGNLKRTTISTAAPSGGANGDVWIKYS